MRLPLIFTLSILAVVIAFPALPQNEVVPSGENLRYGLCERSSEEQYAQPDSAAGYATVGDLRITRESTIVSLERGAGFGFEWRAIGLPAQSEAAITYRISHPRIVRPDGRVLTQTVEEVSMKVAGGTIETTDCYFLSEPHELVSGEWEIAVLYRGTELVSKRFQVQPGHAL